VRLVAFVALDGESANTRRGWIDGKCRLVSPYRAFAMDNGWSVSKNILRQKKQKQKRYIFISHWSVWKIISI